MGSINMASTATNQLTKNKITLRGSTAIVSEFFGYAINSILYQRAIYPEEHFEAKKKYNLQIMVTKNNDLRAYLNKILQQMQQWLIKGNIRKFVLVIASIDDGTILERWNFDVETDQSMLGHGHDHDDDDAKCNKKPTKIKSKTKAIKEIQNEIR